MEWRGSAHPHQGRRKDIFFFEPNHSRVMNCPTRPDFEKNSLLYRHLIPTSSYALRHPWNTRYTGPTTSPKKHFSPEISRHSLCVHKFIWLHACCSHMSTCVIHQLRLKNLFNSELQPSLHTSSWTVCAHSWSKMVSRMRHHLTSGLLHPVWVWDLKLFVCVISV